ncbi:MAG TPA: PIN domain-containing protein [Thermoanaerobaculia bacterium]|nr:PIN domain-containing protein [Thermoanaerobaculia bacterium]
MKVLVDTVIWSVALRRRRPPENRPLVEELAALVEDQRAAIIGPIRQELLSGVREPAHYQALRDHLRAFPDVEIISADYEEAAAFFNRCRSRGVQGSNTDFLICAVAARNDFAVFTADEDFARFAKILPLTLHRPSK